MSSIQRMKTTTRVDDEGPEELSEASVLARHKEAQCNPTQSEGREREL